MIQQPTTLRLRAGYKRAFICHSNGNITIEKKPIYKNYRLTKTTTS